MIKEYYAVMLFDKFHVGENDMVYLAETQEEAQNKLVDLYRAELLKPEHVNSEKTFISNDLNSFQIDGITSFIECRITKAHDVKSE